MDSILILIREIPAAKEAGLAHLCEFIEVCTQALLPASYVRFIADFLCQWHVRHAQDTCQCPRHIS